MAPQSTLKAEHCFWAPFGRPRIFWRPEMLGEVYGRRTAAGLKNAVKIPCSDVSISLAKPAYGGQAQGGGSWTRQSSRQGARQGVRIQREVRRADGVSSCRSRWSAVSGTGARLLFSQTGQANRNLKGVWSFNCWKCQMRHSARSIFCSSACLYYVLDGDGC